MNGLAGLRMGIWAKATFVVLTVLGFLSLGAFFSLTAKAVEVVSVGEEAEPLKGDLVDDPVVEEVVEVLKEIPTGLEQVLQEENALDGLAALFEDEDPPAGLAQFLGVQVDDEAPPVDDEVVDDVDAPLVDLIEVDIPLVESASPVIDEAGGSPPRVGEVVVPPEQIDVTVSSGPYSPGAATVGRLPDRAPGFPLNEPRGNVTVPTKEHIAQTGAEPAPPRLAGLVEGSPSPFSDQPALLAGYVPFEGPAPVTERGPVGSGSAGQPNLSGALFGGLDAASSVVALWALLALGVVAWIRDRSRYGRSIFRSLGRRPR